MAVTGYSIVWAFSHVKSSMKEMKIKTNWSENNTQTEYN
jgi:hypothetical protein